MTLTNRIRDPGRRGSRTATTRPALPGLVSLAAYQAGRRQRPGRQFASSCPMLPFGFFNPCGMTSEPISRLLARRRPAKGLCPLATIAPRLTFAHLPRPLSAARSRRCASAHQPFCPRPLTCVPPRSPPSSPGGIVPPPFQRHGRIRCHPLAPPVTQDSSPILHPSLLPLLIIHPYLFSDTPTPANRLNKRIYPVILLG